MDLKTEYRPAKNGDLTECVVIDRLTGELSVDSCESKGKGYICRTGSNRCPVSVSSYNCVKVNGHFLIVGCDGGNWFGARDHCRRLNSSLLFVENDHSAQQVKRTISTLGIRSCDSLWLGTRYSDWYIDRSEGRKLLYPSRWNDKNPKSIRDENCSYLSKTPKGIYLKSSECSREYPFFCERASNTTISDGTYDPAGLCTTEFMSTDRVESPTVFEGDKGMGTHAIVFLALVVVLVPITVCQCILLWRKRRVLLGRIT